MKFYTSNDNLKKNCEIQIFDKEKWTYSTWIKNKLPFICKNRSYYEEYK